MPERPPPSQRARRIALAAILIAQTGWFAWFLHRPPPGVTGNFPPGTPMATSLTPDFERYEVPAWSAAQGHSLSLPLSITGDAEVQRWVCSRHPEACFADGMHPTALYPPGFSIFVAGIYKIAGRSVRAVLVVHYLLLLVLFVLFEALAARLLDGVGHAFVVMVAVSYPFLAVYAALFSTEHLHNTLFLAALASLLLLRPSWWRGALFGLLFALASLVRPYSLVVFPVLWLWPSVWRGVGAGWRERFVAGVLFALPLVAWTARNAYWFGRFIPVTTGGPGVLMMHSTMEWEYDPYSKEAGRIYYDGLAERVGADVASYDGERRLRHLAVERIKQHPGKALLTLVKHVPKLWISVGSTDAGVSRGWLLLLVYMGGLWLLGLYGGWLVRHDAVWHLLLLSIGVYWAFLLYTPGEARRTLALRLPLLLCAGVAASHLWSRFRRRAVA